MKLSKLSIFLLTFMVATFFTHKVFSEEPTKEETINFIKKKTDNVIICFPKSKETSKSNIYFNNCAVVNEIKNVHDNGTIIYHSKTFFHLIDMDPTRVSISKIFDRCHVELNTKEDKKTVKEQELKSNFGKPETIYRSNIFIEAHYGNHLACEKAAKAFRHLIKLCGGKGELF